MLVRLFKWMRWLKQRRSAGVPVSRSVHRLLRRGDRARDAGDWAVAADFYRQALDDAPDLIHIQMQLGHALSEMGDAAAASSAYRRSMATGGSIGEAHLHLGHLATRVEDWAAAARHYAEAGRHGCDEGVERVVERVRDRFGGTSDSVRAAVLELALDAGEQDDAAGLPDGKVIGFDISDLIAHFEHHRLPTGIQRVQAEVLACALDTGVVKTRICCFVRGRSDLIQLPCQLFKGLRDLSRIGGDWHEPAWQAMLGRLHLHATIARGYRFSDGECLVGLGPSWSRPDYFLLVRNAKAQHAITYVALVFDLIPALFPQFSVPATSQAYARWLIGAFHHVDRFVAISRSTADDLVRAASRLGHGDIKRRVAAVPLDADFAVAASSIGTDVHVRHGLGPSDYVLMVATVEPRKNHLLALQAWVRLLRRHPAERVPPLVMVGRKGWLYDGVFAYLASEPILQSKIVIIEAVSDAELADLYRGGAFCLYPSLYEGWGLPVTEALAHGKLVVVADNSSLLEAGGRFASFFESGSSDDLVRALEQAIFDEDWRRAREELIAAEFRPRSWRDIAHDVVEQALLAGDTQMAAGGNALDSAMVVSGRFYPLRDYGGGGLWHGLDGGERLRIGDGWVRSAQGACRIALAGAVLRVRPPASGNWRILLRLEGLARRPCAYRLSLAGHDVEGLIEPATTRWTRSLIVPGCGDAAIDIGIVGDTGEPCIDGAGIELAASITVRGVYLCAADDDRSYAQALSAGLDGDLSGISIFSRSC